MTGEGEERDVRESLGDLERRLLDLERELRTDASEDRTVAAGAPAGPADMGGAEPVGAATGGGGGGVAAPPAPPAPPGPPSDIDLFADDARAKVAALRETLEGLTSATDRLRETAQTVVEDHGRALVRLERATGIPSAPIVIPAMPASVTRPPEVEVPPQAPQVPEPEVQVPEPEVQVPEVQAPEPTIETPEAEVSAPAPAAPTPTPTAPKPAPTPRRRRPRPSLPRRPALPSLSSLPWRRILVVAVAIAVLGLGYALLFGGGGGGGGPKPPALPTSISATDSAITAAGGGITAIPQLGSGSDASIRQDVCQGRIAAGVDVVTPGGSAWSCPGIRQVASRILVASGFARKGSRGRTCVSVPKAPQLDVQRRDKALTARRDAAVRSAARGRAYAAGIAFDKRNGLTLLAGARAPGAKCVEPTPATLRDGTYPLSTRIVLYATAETAGTPEVRDAAAQLRTYFADTPPLYAIVLR